MREVANSVIHELIRLCKYWDKQIHVSGYIEDRATLIELMAIKAGRGFSTSLEGLEKFLDSMQNFHKLEIEFDFDPFRGLAKLKKTATVAKRPPFVIDPANPFYNVANGVNAVQIKEFSEAAIETKSRLEKWRQS